MSFREIIIPPGAVAYSTRVTLDQVTVGLEFRWNQRAQTWFMSFRTPAGEAIAQGIAVRSGELLNGRLGPVDLLPPGQFIAVDTSGQDLDPGPNDLGARVKVLYADVEEILARFG